MAKSELGSPRVPNTPNGGKGSSPRSPVRFGPRIHARDHFGPGVHRRSSSGVLDPQPPQASASNDSLIAHSFSADSSLLA